MKLNHIIFLLFVLIFPGCKEDDPVILFEIPFQQGFVIGAGLDPFQVWHFQLLDIPNPFPGELQQRGLTIDEITQIGPGQAILSTEFDGEDLSFIREITINIYTDDFNNARELFYRADQNLLVATSPLEMIPTLVNASHMVSGETFNIDVAIELRQPTPKSFESILNFTMVVR